MTLLFENATQKNVTGAYNYCGVLALAAKPEAAYYAAIPEADHAGSVTRAGKQAIMPTEGEGPRQRRPKLRVTRQRQPTAREIQGLRAAITRCRSFRRRKIGDSGTRIFPQIQMPGGERSVARLVPDS